MNLAMVAQDDRAQEICVTPHAHSLENRLSRFDYAAQGSTYRVFVFLSNLLFSDPRGIYVAYECPTGILLRRPISQTTPFFDNFRWRANP
jgi:hypothetical protein